MRGAHRGMFGRGMEGQQGNNRQEARAVARISQSMAHRASTQSCAFQPYIQETRYLTPATKPLLLIIIVIAAAGRRQ